MTQKPVRQIKTVALCMAQILQNFFVRNLRTGQIIYHICNWQAYPA
jgi:hypothetical protein